MQDNRDKLQFRQVGKGFILNEIDGLVGRTLTHTFVDQNKQTYFKVNGEIIPLTEQHSYLAVN